MKVIRNINNNVSLCIDSKGKEVVVFGKGLGFCKAPCEIELNRIERTFYNLDNQYIDMLNDISSTSIKLADKVIHFVIDKLSCELNANLLFSLADHIDFAIERYKKNVNVQLPIINDIEHLYEVEMEAGRYALDLIRLELEIDLPDEEAACIALNIINSEYNQIKNDSTINEQVIKDITSMIEKCFDIVINRKSFSYSRFVTHMYYLFKRDSDNKQINSENVKLYQTLEQVYPDTFGCVRKISDYLNETKKWELSDEECLYLILHVNRLCEKK